VRFVFIDEGGISRDAGAAPCDRCNAQRRIEVVNLICERLQHPKAPDVEGRAAQFVLRMLGVPATAALKQTEAVRKRHAQRPRDERQPKVRTVRLTN
jgi:hypothetical protein